MFPEDVGKGWCDALWQKHRDPGSDADEFDMWNRPQFTQQVIQTVVAEQKRITTAQENIAYLRMRADVFESFFVAGMEVVVLGIGYQAAAGAVAAVGCAAIGNEKQDAVGIAVNEPFHRHRVFLSYGIEQFVRADPALA